jgi:predicted RNA-binding Zn-ribbon protein involved in translation (DUF1610 family)
MIPPDKPVKCQMCHKETGMTEKGLMHYVLPRGGLKCPNCGYTVIRKTDVRLLR